MIIKFIKKHPFIITVFFILLVAGSSLKTGWSLVDDGKSAQVSHFLMDYFQRGDVNHFFNALTEPESGRFRPAYWIYLWVTFLLGGTNSFVHHLIQLGLFAACAYFVYFFTKKISTSKFAGVISSTFFVLDWRGLENWYRLGTQEPFQLLLLFFYLLNYLEFRENGKNKNLIGSVIFLTFAALVKETTIAVVGLSIFLVVYDFLVGARKERKRNDLINLVLALVINLAIRFMALELYPAIGYASSYNINLSIFRNLGSYWRMISVGYLPVLILATASFVTRFSFTAFFEGFKSSFKENKWQLFWLFWFISFLIIQLPWGITIGRYLLISTVGLFIFISAEVTEIVRVLWRLYLFSRLKIRRRDMAVTALLLIVTTVLFSVAVLFYQLFMCYSYVLWVLPVSKFNNNFIESINNNTSSSSSIVLNADGENSPPEELFYEMGWHLKYFYQNDAEVKYASEQYSPRRGDLIVLHTNAPLFSKEEIKTRFGGELRNSMQINFSSFVLAGPMKFIEEMPSIILRPNISFLKLEQLLIVSHYSYGWYVYSLQ